MASGEIKLLVSAKDGATRVLSGIEGSVKRFGKALSSVAGQMGMGLGFGAIVSWLVDAVKGLDAIGDAADNLGVTTDALQALNAVARTTGNDLGQVQKSLESVLKAQANLGEDKKLQENLRTLGIDFEKFINLKPEDALALIGKQLGNAADKTAAFSAVSDILGAKVGPRMAAMLKQIGGDSLDGVIQKMKAAGQVADEELVKRAGAAMDNFSASMNSWKNNALSALGTVGDALASIGVLFADVFGKKPQFSEMDVSQAVKAGFEAKKGRIAEGLSEAKPPPVTAVEERKAFENKVAEEQAAKDLAAREDRELDAMQRLADEEDAIERELSDMQREEDEKLFEARKDNLEKLADVRKRIDENAADAAWAAEEAGINATLDALDKEIGKRQGALADLEGRNGKAAARKDFAFGKEQAKEQAKADEADEKRLARLAKREGRGGKLSKEDAQFIANARELERKVQEQKDALTAAKTAEEQAQERIKAHEIAMEKAAAEQLTAQHNTLKNTEALLKASI
jgi:hypothetical protein